MARIDLNFTCNIVITNKNIGNLADFVEFLIDVGVRKITIPLVSDRNHILREEDIISLSFQMDRLIDISLQNPSLKIEPIHSLIGLISNHKLHLYKCGYGRLRINVQPNGDITPCQRLYSNMGNVDTGIDLQVARLAADRHVDNKPTCQLCSIRYLCGGNCYHESLVYKGNAQQPYALYCDFQKRTIAQIGEKMMEPGVTKFFENEVIKVL
jgi:uncharacterized protein